MMVVVVWGTTVPHLADTVILAVGYGCGRIGLLRESMSTSTIQMVLGQLNTSILY